MKTRFLLFLLMGTFLLGTLMTHAQIMEVSGLQSGVWDADTVLVMGDVTVQDSLCIAPGTTVLFTDFYSITTEKNAMLKALGTENDSITFTVSDTTGFHIFNSGRGGWNGIRLEKAGPSRFEYCRFQYGKAALDDDQDGGALRIFYSNAVEIGHSTLFCNFSREHGGALNAEYSTVRMRDCKVNNNMTYTGLDTVYYMYGGGLRFVNCTVDLIGTDFRYNNGQNAIGGALSLDSCSVNVDRCCFEHNYGINGAGLYLIRCYDNPCSITNSLFAGNTSGHFGGGLAISDSSPLICNLTVVNNLSIGVTCGGIFFYQHSSPEVWNCIIYGNKNETSIDEPIQMWSWTYDDYAPEFHNCLVQYGLENISNHEIIMVYENCIDEDPLFQDEDFSIAEDSPCFNAGSPNTPTEVLEGLDFAGNPRVLDGIIDIGAYEVNLAGMEENNPKEPFIRIVGNPVTASSYAEIALKEAGNVIASVYSIEGRMLNNKHLGRLEAGINQIDIGSMFEGLTSGTYMLILSTNNKTTTVKVIK